MGEWRNRSTKDTDRTLVQRLTLNELFAKFFYFIHNCTSFSASTIDRSSSWT